jgi:hypothetical protein
MAKTTLIAPDGCRYWPDGHLCDRADPHCGDHLCKCGHRWHREPPPVAVAVIERVTATPGDVLVFESPRSMSEQEVDEFRAGMAPLLGEDLHVVVVEQAKFVGIVGREPEGVR